MGRLSTSLERDTTYSAKTPSRLLSIHSLRRQTGNSSPHAPTHVLRLPCACQLSPRGDHHPTIALEPETTMTQNWQSTTFTRPCQRLNYILPRSASS